MPMHPGGVALDRYVVSARIEVERGDDIVGSVARKVAERALEMALVSENARFRERPHFAVAFSRRTNRRFRAGRKVGLHVAGVAAVLAHARLAQLIRLARDPERLPSLPGLANDPGQCRELKQVAVFRMIDVKIAVLPPFD